LSHELRTQQTQPLVPLLLVSLAAAVAYPQEDNIPASYKVVGVPAQQTAAAAALLTCVHAP
jgi:hypothetical protein